MSKFDPSILGATALLEVGPAPQLASTSDGPGLKFSTSSHPFVSGVLPHPPAILSWSALFVVHIWGFLCSLSSMLYFAVSSPHDYPCSVNLRHNIQPPKKKLDMTKLGCMELERKPDYNYKLL